MTRPNVPAIALPRRPADSHKGDFGRVLVVAGSAGLAGAAVLCGSAAVRSGAGLVRVATPAPEQLIVAIGNPCYMTAALPMTPEGGLDVAARAAVAELAAPCDVLAMGPGLGAAAGVKELVQAALEAAPQAKVVLDADALSAVEAGRSAGRADWVLTPHPGEFARLVGQSTADVQANRDQLARDFAARHNVVLLLKGHNTIITDGKRLAVNPTGNPGMATGGCGDVLAGIIAGLLGQGLTGYDAAVLGAWVQGRAGDLARANLGELALTARDLLDYLAAAFQEVEAARP